MLTISGLGGGGVGNIIPTSHNFGKLSNKIYISQGPKSFWLFLKKYVQPDQRCRDGCQIGAAVQEFLKAQAW